MLKPRIRNYLWNYSAKLNCAYIEVPKVCCTTIKAMMQAVELDCSAGELSLAQIHDRAASPLLNFDSVVDAGIGDYRTFTFVRNPYTRIYSAYKDKLVDNQWEKDRRAENLGFSAEEEIPFLEFLRVIRDRSEQSMDIHWLSQSAIVEDRAIDFIGRFEQFDNDYYIIASALGLPLDTESRITHSTGTGNSILRRLCREEISIINEIYERDFGSFNYLMLR